MARVPSRQPLVTASLAPLVGRRVVPTMLAFIGCLSYRRQMPGTRPIAPGELAVSD